MNKGIIVVLVLLLLAGAVIAGIAITSKSKYTKDSAIFDAAKIFCQSIGAPLADTNSCAVNYACSKPVSEGGCEGTPQCANTSTTPYPLPGSLHLPDGPPIKDCICSGYGKCEVSASGGANCKCNAGTNLDSNYDCSRCIDGYSWVGDASGKCVALNPCENGGTLGPNNTCKCLAGHGGAHCGCGNQAPGITGNVDAAADAGFHGCDTLVVCPWGAGMKLELDTTYGTGGCAHADQADWTVGPNKYGCYVIPPGTWSNGPDCRFISTFDPALVGGVGGTGTKELVTVQQDQCGLEAGDITVTGAAGHLRPNVSTKTGSYWHDYSGQVLIGPPSC